MSRLSAGLPVLVSVFDRLLDDDPGVSREAPRARGQTLQELKQAVRRDLDHLLNSRQRCLSWEGRLTELGQSLVNYGLPDFTGADMSTSERREDLRRTVEGVIRRFETRFKTVRVYLLDSSEPLDRTLHFRIDALLAVEPSPEPVVYDSAVEPTMGSFTIKGLSP